MEHDDGQDCYAAQTVQLGHAPACAYRMRDGRYFLIGDLGHVPHLALNGVIATRKNASTTHTQSTQAARSVAQNVRFRTFGTARRFSRKSAPRTKHPGLNSRN